MAWLTRFFTLYRRTARSRSAIALIVANVIPLVGVFFFDWSLATILVIYWLENGIVGFWNMPKIVLAGGPIVPIERLPREAAALGPMLPQLPSVARLGMAGFFLVHYGLFWVVHGVFVFALPSFAGALQHGPTFCDAIDRFPPGIESCGPGPFGEIVWSNVVIAAIALFLSHGASFVFNYVARQEYRRSSPTAQMAAPYGRVVVLHLTILFGAFVASLLGAPLGVLLILVVLKTAFDLGLHLREHGGVLQPGVT